MDKRISQQAIDAFQKSLFTKASSPMKFSVFYSYHTDIESKCSPGPITQVLGLDDDFPYSDRETKVLSFLENDEANNKPYCDFKWKVLAFICLQDIFDAPLIQGDDLLSLFHQWYFYYESKYILKEIILCGLNGFEGASGALLRLFLEFNLLQNYVYTNRDKTASYKFIENYFSKGINPNWSSVVKGALPNDGFSKPIRKRIMIHLKRLSETSLHPYHPDFTLIQSGSTEPEPTLERVFFYFKITTLIEPVLWMYYVNLPMLFHGVEIERKFGFNGPVGILADDQTTKIIKKSLCEEDYERFSCYAKSQKQVTDLLTWYHSRKSLTDDEILKSWDSKKDGPIKDILMGHCKQMTKLRGIRESLAFKKTVEGKDLSDDLAHSAFDKMSSYQFWKDMKT